MLLCDAPAHSISSHVDTAEQGVRFRGLGVELGGGERLEQLLSGAWLCPKLRNFTTKFDTSEHHSTLLREECTIFLLYMYSLLFKLMAGYAQSPSEGG